MLRFLARFLAVVLAALFVCATIAFVFIRPIGTQMLSPQTYKEVLREQRVAERLPELTAEVLARATAAAGRQGERAAASPGDVTGFLQAFSPADMQTLLGALLPADYVRSQMDGAIDQFFSYVHSEQAHPSVVLTLGDLKRRLSGGALEDAYIKVLQAKPPCTGDAVTALPVDCCPATDRLPEVRAHFREMIDPAASKLPETVDLLAVSPGAQADSAYPALDQVRNRVRTIAQLARWGWLVPVILLVGVTVFGVRSFRGLLLWWGLPCLIAGAVAAVFALPGAAMGGWVFHNVIAPQLPPEVPVRAVETVFRLVTAVAQVVMGAALKTAGLLAAGGLVAVILSAFFKSRPKPAVAGTQGGMAAP